jgi:hypothetical protein
VKFETLAFTIPFIWGVDHEEFEEKLRRVWVKAQLRKLRREFYAVGVGTIVLAILGAWIVAHWK